MSEIDWSILGNLGKTYKDARNERTLADLGKGLADGSLDYRQAAGMAAQAGRPDLVLPFLRLGEEREADQQAQSTLSGLGNPQMGQPQSQQPMRQSAPTSPAGPVGAPSRLASADNIPAPPRSEVVPTAKTWGDKEAEAAGLYERPAAPMQTAQATPAAQPQSGSSSQELNLSPQQLSLMKILGNRNLSPGAAANIKMLLEKTLPKDDTIQTLADGTILAVNARSGATRELYKSTPKPIVVPAGGSLVGAKGEVIREPSGGGLLDDETISAMADQYRAGDTSVMTNLGRGAQGAENIVKLRAAITRKNASLGDGGADQAMRNAEFFGVKSGQRTLGTRSANIELAATEFKQVLPVVIAASNAVDRTRFPDLNKIIQSYETRTGDPNIVKFGGGVNTLINLYARAISPSGIPTVSDKDHAREILQKSWSQGQFNAAVGMMTQEIDAALASPEKVRDDMRKRFLGGQGGSSHTAPATTPQLPAPAQSAPVDWQTYFGGSK